MFGDSRFGVGVVFCFLEGFLIVRRFVFGLRKLGKGSISEDSLIDKIFLEWVCGDY